MNSGKYWAKRFEQLEEAQNALGKKSLKEIEAQYREAEKQLEGEISRWYQRFADNNNISLGDTRQWLYGADLEEFRWDVWDYIEYGRKNGLDERWVKELENASAKYHISRLDALQIHTRQSLETMFCKQSGTVSSTLGEAFESSYYHTAYEIQKGTGVGVRLDGIDNRKVEKVLSKPWSADGLNFSQRIWKNRAGLINTVHRELTQNLIRGESPQRAIAVIAKEMNTSKRNAGRLVMTETAFFSSAAQRDCFKELDIEQYEIVATLDTSTSELCREMDGKVFDLKDFQVGVTAPPFHPNCRSTTAPYDEDLATIGERGARDKNGEYYTVPSDMTYKDWKKWQDGLTIPDDDDIMESEQLSDLGALGKRLQKDKRVSKEYYSIIRNRFSHGSDDAKRAFIKFVPVDSIENAAYINTPRYNTKTKKILMNFEADLHNNRGRGVTFFHEHGHLIDDMAGGISKDKEFRECLLSDVLNYRRYVERKYHLQKSADVDAFISSQLSDFRKHSAVSDLFDGLTEGEIKGCGFHDPSYWAKDDNLITSEAFAHMFESEFDSARYAEMKKYFPSALEYFEKLLKGVI